MAASDSGGLHLCVNRQWQTEVAGSIIRNKLLRRLSVSETFPLFAPSKNKSRSVFLGGVGFVAKGSVHRCCFQGRRIFCFSQLFE